MMASAGATRSDGRQLKWWGWGFADQQPDRAGLEAVAAGVRDRLGFDLPEVEEPVPLERASLPTARIEAPVGLEDLFSSDPYDRASHALGKAYRDLVRGMRGDFMSAPDLVARPASPEDVDAVLAWCADADTAVIPFGGGTSVVGGVEPRLGEGDARPTVSLDTRRMARVLEVDPVSRAARIEAGATGPELEAALSEHGLTLRHFPQSFEFSTLGGWIATRAGGHFATVETHVDDLVESIRAITPVGEWRSLRLPASGAGPSPDRMLIGSEGALGVVVDAWMRVRPRPRWRASCSVSFPSFEAGLDATREIAQSGLNPANCRLLDPAEAELNGVAEGRAILVLGFESAHHEVSHPLEIAVRTASSHGGEAGEMRATDGEAGERDSAAGAWRSAFLGAPYLRDSLVCCGVMTETFETAVTWDRLASFCAEVADRARRTAAQVTGAPEEGPGAPSVSCRLTHVYPDGAAPYFTVLAPARRGEEIEQWDEVKRSVSEQIAQAGGTITHHHAVGRDHMPWYEGQRPDPFDAALSAAKRAIDPGWMLNPGVLTANLRQG